MRGGVPRARICFGLLLCALSIPVATAAEAQPVAASFGGEIRERYEWVRHAGWRRGEPASDGYFLQRLMLHAELRRERWRAFAELKSGLESGREAGPRATDQDDADVHQAFVEITAAEGRLGSVTMRAGRQELAFGSLRLISTREGPNVRLAFDGLRVSAELSGWRVDGLAVHPVRTRPAAWDDDTDSGQSLWGLYVSRADGMGGAIDFYYLGLDRRRGSFAQGTSEERRHSFGIRMGRKSGSWDSDIELVYQFGAFGQGRIRAWTVASDLGRRFPNLPGQPRFGLKADVTSGDRNPADVDLQTFNPLFPRGAYFGESALVGPANHVDIHPSVTLTLNEALKLQVDWARFWRQSRGDGLYGPAGNLQVGPGSARSRGVGQQLETKLTWNVTDRLTLTADAARFVGSKFLSQRAGARNIDYAAIWATLTF